MSSSQIIKSECFFYIARTIFPRSKENVLHKNCPSVIYFVDFVARNIVVQSDFDLDIRFLKKMIV